MPKNQKSVQENAEGGKHEGADKVCTSLPPPQRAPWLVLFSHGKHRKLHTFVSLSEGRVYTREREGMERSSYYACCAGWLFMIDLPHRSCFLLNLLSSKKIMLPPPPRGTTSIAAAVMTSSPLARGGSLILCYRRDRNMFLFHSPKEDRWDTIKCNCAHGIKTLLNFHGTIYALTLRYELAIIDVVPYPKVRLLPVVEAPAMPTDMLVWSQLLESCGELFLVVKSNVMFTRKLHSFFVYRMDFSQMKWVEVSSLGDRAFFFSRFGHCLSCSASEAGIAANCIYFDNYECSSILKFDMADTSVSTELSWPSVFKSLAAVAWIKILES